MIAGGLVTAAMLPLLIYGSVRVAQADDLDGKLVQGVRYLLPAFVLFAAGVPMLGMGIELWVQRKQYVRAPARLQPQVARTPHGSWTGGVTLRF